jgi:hypothetical protein
MVLAAVELVNAALRLEAGTGGELDRERIRDRLTQLDVAKGQPFQLGLGADVTFYSNQAENVGKKRSKDEPELALGSRPNDAALVAQVRFAVTRIISATTKGHVRAVVVDGKVSAVGTDAYGDALLRIAGQLTQGSPARRQRQCARCGKDITYQRSTRRYCSNACKQAMVRARRRARQEDSR